VDGYFLPWSYTQAIAGLHLLKRNITVRAIRHDEMGCFGGEIKQATNCATGLIAGAQFKHLAQQHQHSNYCRGLKVGGYVSTWLAGREREYAGRHERDHAEAVGNADT